MIIGIPKEIMHGEDRVAAIPATVEKMVKDGHKVLFEKGAGVGAFFPDDDYAKAGAEILDDVKALYEKSDVILKVKEPLFNEKLGVHEVDLMHKGQYLITFIHPANPHYRNFTDSLCCITSYYYVKEGKSNSYYCWH